MALWQGMFVPAGTSKEIIATLNNVILKILDTPELKERFIKAGVQIAPMNTQQFTELYNSDIARWKVVIDKAKIKLDWKYLYYWFAIKTALWVNKYHSVQSVNHKKNYLES